MGACKKVWEEDQDSIILIGKDYAVQGIINIVEFQLTSFAFYLNLLQLKGIEYQEQLLLSVCGIFSKNCIRNLRIMAKFKEKN